MSFKMKAIVPKNLYRTEKLLDAVETGLDEGAEGVSSDFDKTVSGWDTSVDFTITKKPFQRIVGTNNKIYGYVNFGTPAHTILPKRGRFLVFTVGGKAKTAPRVIGSSRGSRGGKRIFARRVRHPGTKAREFNITIAEKWDSGPLLEVVQGQIDKAAKG